MGLSGPHHRQKETPAERTKVCLVKSQKLAVYYLREVRTDFDSIWMPWVKEMVLEEVARPGEANEVDGNRVLARLCEEGRNSRCAMSNLASDCLIGIRLERCWMARLEEA